MIVAVIIFLVSLFYVDLTVKYPLFCLLFAFITTLSFALFGFVIGLVANSFEQLSLMPNFVITPLSFLGGIFYNLEMLPPFWRNVSIFNPFVYMNNGLRYGYYGITDVDPVLCVIVILLFTSLNLAITLWIFRTGFRLREKRTVFRKKVKILLVKCYFSFWKRFNFLHKSLRSLRPVSAYRWEDCESVFL